MKDESAAVLCGVRPKTAEEQLRESEERFTLAVNQVPGSVWTVDRDLRFTRSLGAGLDKLGLAPNQVVGMTLEEYFQTSDPSFLPLQAHRRALAGEAVQYTMEFGGMTYDSRVQPLHDAAGEITGVIGVAFDVTAQVRAEARQRQLQAQMQHVQKLESLGVLAGGIAHDFNNLLLSIVGHTDLAMLAASEENWRVRENLEQVLHACERASDLARQMLAYSGKGKFVLQPVDLSKAVHGAAKMLDVVVSKKATLTCRLAADLPPVLADPGQLCQVIMNLIANASDALEGAQGEIAVATWCAHFAADELRGGYLMDELPAGEYVVLEVRDTGVGMTEETLDSLFEPFFTTKFSGRGLGLAAVLGIVRGHKGTIHVDSAPGKGATFRVLLPVSPDARPAATPTRHPTARNGTHATILVADDDDQVRRLTGHLLEELGYTVVLACDGVDAIRKFQRLDGKVDCLLLDLSMPRLDGIETMVELRRLLPGVRVILASGFAEQAISERIEEPPAAFLQKPYSLDTLAARVSAVLGR